MRKIINTIILILLLYPAVSFLPAFAIDPVVKSIKVGVYDNYPKIYKDENGEIKGFWADITNYIAEKENWKIDYIYDTGKTI